MSELKCDLARANLLIKKEECPACFTQMQLGYEGMFDDRYGLPGLFKLLKCSTCGLVKTSPGLREEDLAGVYAIYYPRKNVEIASLRKQLRDPTTTIGRLKIWLSGTDNQGHYYAQASMKVLDYGCGAGISLLELQAIGAEGYGIEVDASVKHAAKHFRLKIHIGSLEENPFPGIQFDLISLNQVIEHVPEPVRLLGKLRGRLQDDGMAVLSFPNVDSMYRRLFGRRWINWHVPYHVHHFNRKSFTKLCERAGWKVARWRTVTPNLWTILQFRALFVHARMGVPNPVWSPAAASVSGQAHNSPRSRGAMISVVGKGARLMAIWLAELCITVVNRLIDAVGMGDSLVVFIKPARDASNPNG